MGKVFADDILAGKVAYVAPEVVDEGAEPTAQSDLFMVGIVLFFISLLINYGAQWVVKKYSWREGGIIPCSQKIGFNGLGKN